MTGLEMMLSKMIGMTPDQMRGKVNQAVELMESGAKAMQSIQSDLTLIKNHLGLNNSTEELSNVGAIASDSGNSANGSRIQL